MAKPAQFTLRIDDTLLAKLDEVARLYSPPGLTLTKTDALRMVIAAGADMLIARATQTADTPPKK